MDFEPAVDVHTCIILQWNMFGLTIPIHPSSRSTECSTACHTQKYAEKAAGLLVSPLTLKGASLKGLHGKDRVYYDYFLLLHANILKRNLVGQPYFEILFSRIKKKIAKNSARTLKSVKMLKNFENIMHSFPSDKIRKLIIKRALRHSNKEQKIGTKKMGSSLSLGVPFWLIIPIALIPKGWAFLTACKFVIR